MSRRDWKESLSPRCLYAYGIDLQTLSVEDLAGYGVVDVIAVPDPADEREVQRCIQTQGITYKGTTLQVENANNTCDIPQQWEQYVIKPLQCPSSELRVGKNEDNTYADLPRFRKQGDVYSSLLPPMQGQQMQATPGPAMVFTPQFFMPRFPPIMYPPPNMYPLQEATGQDVPAEAGNFPDPKQIWTQQMQMLQQYDGLQAMAGASAAPPPYSVTYEDTCSEQDNRDTVDVVCKRSHNVDGQDLDVKVYHECLGQFKSGVDPFQPPAPVEISDIDDKKLKFLFNSPPNQQAVDKQLEAVYGKPVWSKKSKSNALTIECTLTPETRDCRKLARTWESKVKENLNRFFDLLFVEKHATLQEAFPLVINKLKSLTTNPDAVAVVSEKSNHEFYVTGYKQEVTEISKQVAGIIDLANNYHYFTQAQVMPRTEMSQHYVDCMTCGRYSDFYCNACHQRMCDNCREEHLRNPDNAKHEVCSYKDRKMAFTFKPCKSHPTQKMVLCCKRCQTPICAICTTKEHDGHGFLDLEEVCTKNFRIRFEQIRKIRDNVLPHSRVVLQESLKTTTETREDIERLKRVMTEKAVRMKELVDSVLTERLRELQMYGDSAVKEMENQEKKVENYITRVETLLEERQLSMVSESSEDFLYDMKTNPNVSLDPIPTVSKTTLTVLDGHLSKVVIREQFGFLRKQTNWR